MTLYKHHRSPLEIIQYAVCLYYRFNLSYRDVENLLAEQGMGRFKSMGQAQRFLSAHAEVYNLFNLGRHLVSAKHYRALRGVRLQIGAEQLHEKERRNSSVRKC